MAPTVNAENRRRRKAAYEHAAECHENAAHVHAAAADLFELLGNPGQVEHETALAFGELAAAKADHRRAAQQ
jgi:hypothetical protein